jgi:hypothetical protein
MFEKLVEFVQPEERTADCCPNEPHAPHPYHEQE